MTADAILSRESKSLHDELSIAQQPPPSPSSDVGAASGGTAKQVRTAEESPEEQRLHKALGEFIDAINEFVGEAGKSLSAHPAANVIGGIVLGILIDRMLRRR